ncbi:MAG: DUF973 family protein [Candidatus Korarchaeum sp.]|nr:DUF973 family protein [Candidatus Korarchaeum sp.]MDW8036097.1 DUF973 family protein [Candidatus Korarchaeum sp.]
MSESTDMHLVEAFKNLKLGSILSLLSGILVIASFFPFLLAMPKMMWWAFHQEAPRSLREALTPLMPGILSAAILLLAALIIGIVAIFLWYKASVNFKHYDEVKFSLGRIGAALALIGSLVLTISLVATLSSVLLSAPQRSPEGGALLVLNLLPALAGVIIGALTYVIGWILYGVMVMRLSEIPNLSPDFKYAGILMIAGVVLSILGSFGVVGALVEMASLIMIFVYSDTAIKRLSSAQSH